MKKLVLGALMALSLPLQAQTLVDAVENKDFAAAMTLLKSGTDVNQPSADGTTALHWAAYYGNLDLAKALLRSEAKPNTHNNYGSSPLMEAATVGNYDMMKLLLDAGADVESANPEGQTALMAVARTGNIKAAELLLKHGAKVDSAEKWGGQTALMWAAARNQGDMVKFLLKNKADANKRAIDRNWERRTTSEPRVKEMMTGGLTPLLYAARENCITCIKLLLDAGADVNKPDPDNVSPLILALLNLHFDAAKLLVERGADVNQWDYWGRTPLYAAADMNILPASARGDLPAVDATTGLDIARMLLDRGADPNYALKLSPPPRQIFNDRAGDNPVMTTGSTPLQRAAYGGDVDMMKLLLERHADMSIGTITGVTPMNALTNKGGSRNRNKNETTVIQGLELLVKAGADINQKNATGETPLHTSARQNWTEVVKFIVAHGGDLNAKDNRGLIPLDYAIGKADSQSFGNFNVVGELPEMAALLKGMMGLPTTPTAPAGAPAKAKQQ
ncbi:MAG TPA: ankyrin repeat domain-containing protein [Candidatus Acidoferrum sp.]|nr:ankyrin repeat domain-containing protein [Candidatus Acidoferrum sp.]